MIILSLELGKEKSAYIGISIRNIFCESELNTGQIAISSDAHIMVLSGDTV